VTPTEVALIIGACGTLLGPLVAAFSVVISMRNSRKMDATQENVRKIEVATNHMKDALVAATAKASHAEGLAEGRDQASRVP
jgi:hypothetical protein